MPVQAGFSKIAALLADPAREAMLGALADGRALPAGELALAAGITPQSASGHLRKMIDGGVVSVWSQGRFRYFRLANEQIGALLETLANASQTGPHRTGAAATIPARLATARCCYTHLAGRLGVALADALVEHQYVAIEDDRATLTKPGAKWAEMTGLAANAAVNNADSLRLCLDWTERRFHLAGSIPSAILRHLLDTRCLKRGEERSLIVTPAGAAWFANLGIDATAAAPSATRARGPALRQKNRAVYTTHSNQGNTIAKSPAK
jgi:DNA-binding transcriptional ArsR family regulator